MCYNTKRMTHIIMNARMSENQDQIIPTWKNNAAVLMPDNPNKDEKSRINYFLDWLAEQGLPWYKPDLEAYRDYLLYERERLYAPSGSVVDIRLSKTTVLTHLSTIRGRYYALLRDNDVRQMLFNLTPKDASPADKKAMVDELLGRIQNAVHPSTAQVKVIEKQDRADMEYLRLKPHQVRALLRAPGMGNLQGVRDTAMIAMMVCTGIREAEMCALDVSDLRQTLNGELALRVRSGKGAKQRLIPYGPLDWCLVYVDRWLHDAEITAGVVFRGFYKGSKRVRRTGITTRSVNRIMNRYTIMINGELRDVKPHDLRRTYARNAYDGGLDIERIRQNLGHVTLQTTQNYIGELDGAQRRPPEMFTPAHDLEVIGRW